MKRSFAILAAIVLTLAPGAMVGAAPVAITFSGHVGEVNVEDGAVDTGVNLGDPVSYSLLIDFDRLGTRTTWDGTQYVTEELDAATSDFDTFYVKYVSGYLIDDGLIAAVEPHPDISNFGYSLVGSMLFLGSANHGLAFIIYDETHWTAREQAYDANGAPDLIDIASGSTIPLPATILLLGSALTGMVGVRSFRRQFSDRPVEKAVT